MKARKLAPVMANISQRTGQDHAKPKRISVRQRKRMEAAKNKDKE